MIDVSKQVDYINTIIDGSIKNIELKNRMMYGLAGLILTSIDDKEKKLPAIKDGKEYEQMIFDDRNTMMSYHRNRLTNIILNPNYKGYGDSVNDSLVKISMNSMIVFLNVDEVEVSPEVLANSIFASFPSSIEKTKLDRGVESVRFTVMGFDFDSIAIFRREYDGLPYDLNNGIALIEVKYKIECVLNKGCINTCF